jgi:predicted flap endonuclease-1-like 5' DNA nuclease
MFLVTGLMLGLALSYGSGADTPALTNALKELRGQNAELQESLRHHRDAYAALERKHAEQREQTRALAELQFRIESSLREHEVEHEGLEEGLRAIREIRQRALRDLEDERRSRVAMESHVQTANANIQKLQQQLASVTSECGTLRSLSDRQQHDRKLADLAVSRYQELVLGLQTALGESLPTLVESDELDTGAIRTKIAQLVRDHEAMQCRVSTVQREMGEALSRLANERRQREALDQMLLNQELQLKSTQTSAKATQDWEARVQLLQEQCDQHARTIEELLLERQHAVRALELADQTVAELRHELDSHRRAMDVLERERQKAANRADTHAAESLELQAQLRGQQEFVSRFDRAHTELKSLREHNALLQGKIAELHHEVRQNRVEWKSSTQQAEVVREENETLKTRFRELERELDRVRVERNSLVDSLKDHLAEQETGQAELAVLRQKLLQAQNQAHADSREAQTYSSTEEDLARTRELEKTIVILREQLRMAQVQVQETLQRRSSHPQTLDMGSNEISDQGAAVIRGTEQRRFVLDQAHRPEELLERIRNRRPASTQSPDADTFDPEKPRTSETQTLIHPRRGLVFVLPPDRPDNLRQISGIGDQLQQRLNELGIYTFDQIIDWDSTAIDEFSRLLSLKDRIVREDWKGQARRLRQRATEEVAA